MLLARKRILQNLASKNVLRSVSTQHGFTIDADAFHRDGVGVVESFVSPEECDRMMEHMSNLIDDWDPKTLEVFRTDGKQCEAQGKSDYFLDSADRVHFFLETGAVDEETGGLRSDVEKHESINKVGHGLHVADEVFSEYSSSEKVLAVAQALGWKDPVLPQSMYIFKQPRIGGEVTSHQDSTFLFTTPRQTCLGLWLALQDATLQNGCIWARPGSHKEPIRRHFKRNPEHFGNSEVQGDPNAAQMIFEDFEDLKSSPAPWEGKLPEGFPQDQAAKDAGFQAYPVKKGDLVLIHGAVDHMSLDNTSNQSRHTFQLHLVEGPSEGIEWSPDNWLQFPKGKTFPKLGGIKKST